MWTLTCQRCGKSRNYHNSSNYNRALRGNRLCNGCSRTGQKRTSEQCERISKATKVAMSDPEIKRRFMESYTPENRKKRSNSTVAQMNKLKSDVDLWGDWLQKQSDTKINYWKRITEEEMISRASKLSAASKRMWSDPEFKQKMSEMFVGEKNPFYGRHHTQATREKLRKITVENILRFWDKGLFKGFNSGPERKFQSILTQNNIEFVTPFVIENKIFDIYVPLYDTIVEIDGCYWHSKGVDVKDMTPRQLKGWRNDRFKDALAKKYEIRLIRIWEDEIDTFNIEEQLVIPIV
jgi:hypothetical protein